MLHLVSCVQARLEVEGQQAAAAKNKWRAELNWVRRQPKARSTKSRSRLEAFEKLEARVAAAPKPLKALRIDSSMKRLGSSVLKFADVAIDAGERTLVSGFSYDFSKGERIGICGPNGAQRMYNLTYLRL